MKMTIKAKIIIETDKYRNPGLIRTIDKSDEEITLSKIKEEIEKGHYILEWINSELNCEPEPTIIIKF